MIRIDKVGSWLFVVAFASLLPAARLLPFIDELIMACVCVLAVGDCIVNGNWRRYHLMWCMFGVMSAYAVYSVTLVHYNTIGAVFVDWILQLKPYVPFVVFMVVPPVFDASQRKVLKCVAVVNVVLSVASMFLPGVLMRSLVGAIYYPGAVVILSAVVYAFASEFELGDKLTAIVVVVMLLAGVACTRSKYYGEAIVALFFLFVYRRGFMSVHRVRKIAVSVCVVACVVAAGWGKFSYYFLMGDSDRFDADVLESFARPVLYVTGGLIVADEFPFGSGLASFASHASSDPYSSLYYDYGINNVYGLSPDNTKFITDAYYPSLAQFGAVGIVLFVVFWAFVGGRLRKLIRIDGNGARREYACGWILVFFILIESVGGCTFVQSLGMCAMMMLGALCSSKVNKEDTYVRERIQE